MTTLPPAATANVEVEQAEPPEGEQEQDADEVLTQMRSVDRALPTLAALSLHEPVSLNVLPLPPEIILDILSSPALRPRDLAALYRAADLVFDRITVRVDYKSDSVRYYRPVGRQGAWTTLADHPHLRNFVREAVVTFEESDLESGPLNLRQRVEIDFQTQVSEMFSSLDGLEKVVWLSETDSRTETLVFRQSWLLTVTSLDIPVFFPWVACSLPSLTTLRTKAQLDEGVDTSIPPPARLQHLVVHYQAFGDKPIEFFNWITSNSFDTLTSLSIPCDFYLLGFPPSPHQDPLDPARLFRPTISHLPTLHTLVLSAPSARQNLVSIGPPSLPAWPPSLRNLAIYTLPPARRSRSVDHVPLPWLYDRAAGRTFPSTLHRLVLDRRVVSLDELVRLVQQGTELPQLQTQQLVSMSTNPSAVLPEVEDVRSKVELDEEEQVANEDRASPSSAAQPLRNATSSSWPPFPPEVFLDILMSDLTPADLAACALVCRELFPLARQCLYRSIPIHAVSAVASMRRDISTRRYWLQRKSGRLWPRLLEDRDLLSLVRRVDLSVLRDFCDDDEEPTLPRSWNRPLVAVPLLTALPELLTRMVNLREICCGHSYDGDDENAFLQQVSLPGVTTLTISALYPETAASLPSLTSLVTRFLFHPYSPGKVIAEHIVAPRGLKHLVFYLHKHQNPILSQFNWVLSRSRHTLTSLHVPFDFWAPLESERAPFHPSFSRFSALRSLTLRTDEYLREPPAGSRPSAYPAYPPTLQTLKFDLCTYETIPPLYGLPADPSFPSSIESLFLCPGVIEPAAMLRLLEDESELPRLGTLDVDRVRKEWEETNVDSKGEEGEKRSALEVLRELCSGRAV